MAAQTKLVDVKFIHLRDHGTVKNKKTGKVDPAGVLPTGGVTIGYVKDGTDLFYSFAECSERDVFSKKIGRKITSGRIAVGKCERITVDEGLHRQQLVKKLQQEFYLHKEKYFADVTSYIY